MLGRTDLGLVALEPLVEVVLSGQTEFNEQGQGTIDRCLARMLAPLAQRRRDVVRGQMAGGLEQDLRDSLALVRERKLPLTELTTKNLHHHGRAP